MDYQKELILFLEHFAPNQSQDVRDAVELDASFHVINVPKLLAVKGLSENYVFRLKDSWNAWKAAKAQAVPEGFVLVEKKNTEDWYLDDCEGMWWDHDGIDGSLCELDIGEVQAVEHKEYLITENNTLYATRVWDDANDQVDCWQFFKTKEEAEKAAAYCKAKFYEEAQEPTND